MAGERLKVFEPVQRLGGPFALFRAGSVVVVVVVLGDGVDGMVTLWDLVRMNQLGRSGNNKKVT